MPEEKPPGLLTNTPVMTGRTVEVHGKLDNMQSPMMSPNVRKDQIKNQALQTLRGFAGASPAGNLSKFGPPVPGKKEEETKGNEGKIDAKVAKATAQLKKMGI